jgi:hypothetical protein
MITPKNKTIETVLVRLQEALGNSYFDIVDHWEGDTCAVGIARPDNHSILAYISTWMLQAGHYDVHLELPPLKEGDVYEPAGLYESVDFDGLVGIITRHFEAVQNDSYLQ